MPINNADYKEEVVKRGLVSGADIAQYGLGDGDFDEARNRQIIANSVKRTNEIYRKKMKDFDEGLQERSHIIAGYIKHLVDKGGGVSIEKYAGWETMKKLWGEARAEEIQRRALIAGYNI